MYVLCVLYLRRVDNNIIYVYSTSAYRTRTKNGIIIQQEENRARMWKKKHETKRRLLKKNIIEYVCILRLRAEGKLSSVLNSVRHFVVEAGIGNFRFLFSDIISDLTVLHIRLYLFIYFHKSVLPKATKKLYLFK